MSLIVDLHHVLHGKLGIALGGGKAFVAEHLLNGTKVGAFLQHVSAEGMTQGVRMDIRRKAFRDRDFLDDAAYAARGEAAATLVDQQSRQIFFSSF